MCKRFAKTITRYLAVLKPNCWAHDNLNAMEARVAAAVETPSTALEWHDCAFHGVSFVCLSD